MPAERLTIVETAGSAPTEPIRVTSVNRPGDDLELVEWLLRRAAMDGHTALPTNLVLSGLAGCGVADPAALLRLTLDERGVRAVDDRAMLALTSLDVAEAVVADNLLRRMQHAEPLCREGSGQPVLGAHSADLDETQVGALTAAMNSAVSLLVDSPATGLVPTLAALVSLVADCQRRTAIGTWTARAAKQLAAALSDAVSGPVSSATVSSVPALLQGDRSDSLLDDEQELGLVVVTDAALLDVPTAAALLEAVPDRVHLVLAGDAAELPSAGPGVVFADLLASGVFPSTELTALHRRHGAGAALARLGADIRDGRLPAVNAPDREIVLVPAAESGQTVRRVVQLVTDSIPRALGIPAGDIQVVTPLRRGSTGSAAINAALKEQLNPGPGHHAGFDVGDRVAVTSSVPGTTLGRGDVGVVAEASDSGLRIQLAAGPVDCPASQLGSLTHGWAVTASVAQGSRWPAVVAVLPGEAAGSLSRPLVYTMVSRAERHLSVVHSAGAALPRAVATVPARSRWTRLPARVRQP